MDKLVQRQLSKRYKTRPTGGLRDGKRDMIN